ncbi:MAG TPA: ABC transporter substrate-binding protein [Stellaceae bacterium]|nr:ABC transporter substrate-binding protein [Stellaceae bacterium]
MACAASLLAANAEAETVRIGIVKSTMVGDARIALERGYFEKEDLQVQLVDFESAQPVAVATASGDIDFGSVGLTGGFYSLAGQGVLKIVSGGTRDVPGYQLGAYLVSNAAYDSGLRAFKDLAGKKIAVTQIGSPYHYSLALGAAKHGIDLKGLEVTPVQSVPNEVSAIIGNKVDAALIPVPAALPLVNRGQAHLLGFTGDQAAWQFGIVFTSTKTDTTRHAMVERFLKALHRGGQDYHDAFTGPNGERKDGPTAAAIEELLAKSSNQPLEQIKLSISYLDPQGELDTQDVASQIAWYRDQGMLKAQFGVDDIIDSRVVKALSAH